MGQWLLRLFVCGAVAAQVFLASPAAATEWIALHLYQFVELSDLIAIGTIVDSENGVVRVDEIFKGKSDPTIRLVEIVDPFARSEDRKPLINGARELLFLRRQSGSYAPLQILSGRWNITKDDNLEARGAASRSGATVAVFRQKILQLVRLQSDVARQDKAIDAYVTGLRSNDSDIRLWAAHKSASEEIKPSDRLLDELVRHWQTNDEMRGAAANLIIRWRVRRVAPMLARRLQQGDDGERVSAVRALGGAGDRAYLDLVRSTATSDSSEIVRAYAYEGLAHLLGAESIDDLRRGAADLNPRVRGAIASHAYNLHRQMSRDDVRGGLRRLVEQLRDDPDPSVSGSARHVLAIWERP